MKEKYSRRGAFSRALARWGDLVTFDHLYSGSYRATGLGGEREGFVIKDVYTGLLHVYLVEDKSSFHLTTCIKAFSGRRKICQAYSDNAPEFLCSARDLQISLATSTPGIPHTNSIIERSNQLIVGSVTACLIEAGLPPCYWSHAAPCFCAN